MHGSMNAAMNGQLELTQCQDARDYSNRYDGNMLGTRSQDRVCGNCPETTTRSRHHANKPWRCDCRSWDARPGTPGVV
jgi:hypothetical protein